jgi:uncharacterized protein (TIGR00255 family)
MIKSMTAYGRGTITLPHATYCVEITSVNRKNCDIAVTLPRDWAGLEIEVRRLISDRGKRGSMIIKIARENSFLTQQVLPVDAKTMLQVKEEVLVLQRLLGLSQAVSFEFLYEQALRLKAQVSEAVSEEELNLVKDGVIQAVLAWDEMRALEGQALSQDLKSRIHEIGRMLDQIEKQAPMTVRVYEDKLKKRLMESHLFQEGDFERICREVLLYSDKIDITEEMIRLRSHLRQLMLELDDGAPAVGKKLDFLMQELHREANSLGVKCQDLEVIQIAVSIKSELEKIREQVQNIE